jgi:hypothetical protein
VRFIVKGAQIWLYINGHLAWSGSDTTIPEAGKVGLMAYGDVDPSATYYFDNLVIETHPASIRVCPIRFRLP